MAALLGAVYSAAAPISAEQKEQVLDAVEEIIVNRAFVPNVDFTRWPTFLENHRKQIDEAADEDGFRNAVNASLREFGFSHIALMSPAAAQARAERATIGVGITIRVIEEGLQILRLIPNAPAAEAGLQVGDIIVEAGNVKNPQDTTPLRGEEGEPVQIKVKRPSGKIDTITILRRKFSTVIPETLVWTDKKTAVLTVPTFDNGYNRKRIEELMTEGAQAENLVLDLRSNGGGAVMNLVHLMGLFLPEGTVIGTFISRLDVEQYKEETGAKTDDLAAIARWCPIKLRAVRTDVKPFKGRVAVLVDGYSGSAAEMAAAALREIMHAPVVGEKSAGAVLASVFAPLPNGFQIQYPMSDYITLNGFRLEGNGVKPDLEVKQEALVMPGQKDESVEKALMLLERERLRETRASS